MSGEFGDYTYPGGYIDSAIRYIADDCLENGEKQSTRAFGALLHQIAGVAHNIAYNEAGDSLPRLADVAAIDSALQELIRFRDVYRDEASK